MKFVHLLTLIIAYVWSGVIFAENVPANGYTQYQKARVAESVKILENFGAIIEPTKNNTVKIKVHKDSFDSHVSQYLQTLSELPSDTKGVQLYVYTPNDFDKDNLLALIAKTNHTFKDVKVIDKLGCTSLCNNVEFYIF